MLLGLISSIEKNTTYNPENQNTHSLVHFCEANLNTTHLFTFAKQTIIRSLIVTSYIK